MPSFSGKFQYRDTSGHVLQDGSCRVTFEQESFTLVPGSGAPFAFDLGDIDLFSPADYELTVTLYTGDRILLRQFAKTFQTLHHELLEAYRERLLECLLLEDLEEISRFDGVAQVESLPDRGFSSPAEFRLYKSNLAVLPTQATEFQWRLANIDALNFDETSYTVAIDSAGARLRVSKLAKRTREFYERLQETIAAVNEKGAKVVHELFPFLTPDQFRQVAQLMKEGRAASLAKLKVIHPKTEQALVSNVVDERLKPYFESLMSRVPAGSLYTGFKMLRKEEGQKASDHDGEPSESDEPSEKADTTNQEVTEEPPAEGEAAEEPILHWFFFPLATTPTRSLAGNLVAWEATSKSGRATYFFRPVPPEQSALLQDASKAASVLDAAIDRLNRAIVLLNFRREPIYLPGDSLEIQPRFRRYAIACRKIPELRHLRAAFLGRAIHTSFEAWQKQFESFLAKA